MLPNSSLSARQRHIIEELLDSIAPDFAMTISNQLDQELHADRVRNPVAFVRYRVLAVRLGRFGPNRDLHIPRTRMATTGADRQLAGEDQSHG